MKVFCVWDQENSFKIFQRFWLALIPRLIIRRNYNFSLKKKHLPESFDRFHELCDDKIAKLPPKKHGKNRQNTTQRKTAVV